MHFAHCLLLASLKQAADINLDLSNADRGVNNPRLVECQMWKSGEVAGKSSSQLLFHLGRW